MTWSKFSSFQQYLHFKIPFYKSRRCHVAEHWFLQISAEVFDILSFIRVVGAMLLNMFLQISAEVFDILSFIRVVGAMLLNMFLQISVEVFDILSFIRVVGAMLLNMFLQISMEIFDILLFINESANENSSCLCALS